MGVDFNSEFKQQAKQRLKRLRFLKILVWVIIFIGVSLIIAGFSFIFINELVVVSFVRLVAGMLLVWAAIRVYNDLLDEIKIMRDVVKEQELNR